MLSRSSLVAPSLVLVALFGTLGCGSGSSSSGTGGASVTSTGGSGTGGSATGSGGSSVGTGGAGTGGAIGSGGRGTGGVIATGGNAVVGTGGSVTGGNGMGGSATGGAGVGGLGTGGKASGGAGGVGTGGAATGGAGGSAAGCLTFGTPTQVGTIAAAVISAGPSGTVASRAHPGVLYSQMDLGGPSTVFATTTAGTALSEYALMGVTQNDWEDLAVGPGPAAGSYIYVADIGDNNAVRTEIQIYRFAEPAVTTTQTADKKTITDWQVLRFTYPDKAHNAESLIVDPITGDIVIVTKEAVGTTALFSAPGNTPADKPTVLTKGPQVAVALSASGDISPNGDRYIFRNNTNVLIWPRASSLATTFAATPHSIAFTGPTQSEGVTFAADGKSWFTTAEGSSAIYQAVGTCP